MKTLVVQVIPDHLDKHEGLYLVMELRLDGLFANEKIVYAIFQIP
jgi:hypothetical protein